MKIKSLSSLLCLSLLSSLNVYAKVTPAQDGNGYEVYECNFKPGTGYKVQIGNILQPGQVNQAGCVKTTFRDGKAQPGQFVIITVDGVQPMREQVPGQAQQAPAPRTVVVVQPQQQPRPVQQQPMQQQPTTVQVQSAPVQQLPSVRIFDAQQAGMKAAEKMEEKIVNIYAQAENINYNLFLVFSGIAAQTSPAAMIVNSDYILGVQQGKSQGSIAGEADGKAKGVETGDQLGSQAATSRFSQALDRGQPDLKLTIPSVSFNGLQDPQSQPTPIVTRLAQKQAQIIQSLPQIAFDDYSLDMATYWNANNINLATMYGWQQYSIPSVRDRYPADLVLRQYVNHELGGKYSLDFYNEIGDSTRISNSGEARAAFENAFRGTYNSQIDAMWANRVHQQNSNVQLAAFQIGEQIKSEYMKEMGVFNGFAQTYQTNSAE